MNVQTERNLRFALHIICLIIVGALTISVCFSQVVDDQDFGPIQAIGHTGAIDIGPGYWHKCKQPTDHQADDALDLILEYGRECYADSTEVLIPTRIIYPGPDGDPVEYTIHRSAGYYVHKKPTFEGFILWLKKRIK